MTPTSPRSSSPLPRKRPSRWPIVALAAIVVAAIALLGLSLPGLLTPPVPTPQCVQPTLTLGAARFRIESIARAPDGSLAAAPGDPGAAYWVDGTQPHYVFVLSASPDNLALAAQLQEGNVAAIQWADCGQESYSVSGIESGPAAGPALFDAPERGIKIVVLAAAPADNVIINAGSGALVVDTPVPDESQVQAEISFLGQTASADGQTLSLSIAVKNTGDKDITFSASDLSLTPEGGAPLSSLSVTPALPQVIAPGAETGFEVVFAHPGASPALFTILDFTTDLYF